MERYDVAVVGAGIVGLAHALAAWRRGARVLLLERASRSLGASVRNFGMFWPLGQPAGPGLLRALRSRRVWLECAREAGFRAEACGAMHLATERDEMDVLEEFDTLNAHAGYETTLLSASEAATLCPGVRRDRVIGALRSGTELAIDPLEAVPALARLLSERGVDVRFGSHVRSAEPGVIECADGVCFGAGRIVVCSGAELRTLFPAELASAGLLTCKLQMMRTGVQPGGWRIGCHLAAGLSLIHYKAFASCPSLARLRARLEARYAGEISLGVHALVSQTGAGELTLGDSHEYDPEVDPFDKASIDQMVLDYLATFFDCPDPQIAQRWHGVYTKRADGGSEWVERVRPGVFVVTGLGSTGMTLSFALAEETMDAILQDRPWSGAGGRQNE